MLSCWCFLLLCCVSEIGCCWNGHLSWVSPYLRPMIPRKGSNTTKRTMWLWAPEEAGIKNGWMDAGKTSESGKKIKIIKSVSRVFPTTVFCKNTKCVTSLDTWSRARLWALCNYRRLISGWAGGVSPLRLLAKASQNGLGSLTFMLTCFMVVLQYWRLVLVFD